MESALGGRAVALQRQQQRPAQRGAAGRRQRTCADHWGSVHSGTIARAATASRAKEQHAEVGTQGPECCCNAACAPEARFPRSKRTALPPAVSVCSTMQARDHRAQHQPAARCCRAAGRRSAAARKAAPLRAGRNARWPANCRSWQTLSGCGVGECPTSRSEQKFRWRRGSMWQRHPPRWDDRFVTMHCAFLRQGLTQRGGRHCASASCRGHVLCLRSLALNLPFRAPTAVAMSSTRA